jgi:thioredoxin 1
MSSDVKQVNSQDFEREVLARPGVALVDFSAPWCAPCRVIAPAVEGIARDYQGRVTVAEVNADESPELAARYDVRAMPTLVFFRDGQPVDQIVGAVPRKKIEERLLRLVTRTG